MTQFIINEETDFIPATLRDHLNEKFKCKKNGEPFNHQDIQQYCLRGRVPKAYGGQEIEIIDKPEFNLKILRLKERTDGKS